MKRAFAVVAALALGTAAAAQGAAPIVRADVQPESPLFGDSFAYVLDVAVAEGEAGSVRVVNGVGPFTRVAPTRVSRSIDNGVARTTVTETIACLTAQCLPGPAGKPVTLPRARVTVDGARVLAPAVGVQVGSRVEAAAVSASRPAFRRPSRLAEATTRFEPALAGVALFLVGVSLLVGGLAVITVPLRGRRPGARRSARADPVERAVRLLRESATRDSTDRRRAASLAARIVEEPDVAVDAAHVAWSRGDPAPPDAAALADRVEQLGQPAAGRGA